MNDSRQLAGHPLAGFPPLGMHLRGWWSAPEGVAWWDAVECRQVGAFKRRAWGGGSDASAAGDAGGQAGDFGTFQRGA